jgi:hypothetical protein
LSLARVKSHKIKSLKYIRDAIKKIKIQRTNLGFSQIPNSNPKDVKMALFHSNETVCFDQNNIVLTNTKNKGSAQ